MIHLDTIRALLDYNDWANSRVLECASSLTDAQLDTPLEIGPGPGTLRRILTHTWAGEFMWLRRWRSEPAIPWPDESEPLSVAQLTARYDAVRRDRNSYIAALRGPETLREQEYRDSKGGLFSATLGDMLMQACIHSTHHRAQAVNALRRLGAPGGWPELDYMMRIRTPA